jgi:hypothetical protein
MKLQKLIDTVLEEKFMYYICRNCNSCILNWDKHLATHSGNISVGSEGGLKRFKNRICHVCKEPIRYGLGTQLDYHYNGNWTHKRHLVK